MKPEVLERLRELCPEVTAFEPDVVTDLFTLADAVEKIERDIRELAEQSGMPAHHFFIVEHLALQGGVASLGELLEAVALPKQSATYVIDRLERDGVVERRRDTQDRRRLDVVLTAEGFALAKQHFGPFYRALLTAVAEVPASNRRAVARGLQKMRDELRARV